MAEVATVFTNLLRLIIAPDFGRAVSKDKDQSIRSRPIKVCSQRHLLRLGKAAMPPEARENLPKRKNFHKAFLTESCASERE